MAQHLPNIQDRLQTMDEWINRIEQPLVVNARNVQRRRGARIEYFLYETDEEVDPQHEYQKEPPRSEKEIRGRYERKNRLMKR